MKLVIDQVSKSFGNKHVIDNLSGAFVQGKIYGLLGRNGAGKTTLFSLIAEELRKDHGSVYLEDETGKHPLSMEDLFFMIAEPSFPSFLTGNEFIRFFMEGNRSEIKGNRSLDDYFQLVDFEEEDRDRLISGYSTGMKNKLQMIMFLILQPKVILMDEPLTSLDVVVQLQIKKLIRSIRGDHIILFSTHILQLAEDLCDELVILSRGKLRPLDQKILQQSGLEEKIIRLLSDDIGEDQLREVHEELEKAEEKGEE